MNTFCNLYFYLRVVISDCRSEIKIAQTIVDKDDTKLSQRGTMTLVIELEQNASKASLRSIDELTAVGGACRTSGA